MPFPSSPPWSAPTHTYHDVAPLTTGTLSCRVRLDLTDGMRRRPGSRGLGTRSRLFSRSTVPSVRFKLSTGDSYSREVESEEAAVEQVKSFFDRHDEYLRDWIKVDGNAWIVRSAVVAVEVHTEPHAPNR